MELRSKQCRVNQTLRQIEYEKAIHCIKSDVDQDGFRVAKVDDIIGKSTNFVYIFRIFAL